MRYLSYLPGLKNYEYAKALRSLGLTQTQPLSSSGEHFTGRARKGKSPHE